MSKVERETNAVTEPGAQLAALRAERDRLRAEREALAGAAVPEAEARRRVDTLIADAAGKLEAAAGVFAAPTDGTRTRLAP